MKCLQVTDLGMTTQRLLGLNVRGCGAVAGANYATSERRQARPELQTHRLTRRAGRHRRWRVARPGPAPTAPAPLGPCGAKRTFSASAVMAAKRRASPTPPPPDAELDSKVEKTVTKFQLSRRNARSLIFHVITDPTFQNLLRHNQPGAAPVRDQNAMENCLITEASSR